MSLTVRQALQIGPLKQARVVAGEQGLDREVTYVNIMEVPEVARWMKGGELLVTAGFPLRDNPSLRQRLIQELAAKGVAAFGIKPGQYLDRVPQDMIEVADRIGLPLLELPRDLPYMDIMLPVFELLINEQHYRQRRAEEIHDLLLNVILGGTGLQGVCQALASFSANPVFIFAYSACLGQGYPLPASVDPPPDLADRLKVAFQDLPREVRELPPHRAAHLKLAPDLPYCVVVPVSSQPATGGYLVIVELSRPLNDVEMRGLETGATIVALEFAKQKAVAEAEIRVRGELLDEILQGQFQDEAALYRRAAYLGLTLSGRLAVLVVGLNAAAAAGLQVDIQSEIMHLLRSRFSRHAGGLLLASRGDQVVGLLRVDAAMEAEMAASLQRFQEEARGRFPGAKLRVGVGRAYEGLKAIRTSFAEAEFALKVAWRGKGATRPPVFFASLGAARVLFLLRGQPEAASFCREYVGKIMAHDHENRGGLLTTAACYLKNGGNLRATAAELYVHKNTVIYRVKKIGELTGLNLAGSAEDRFQLALALKLAELGVGEER